jgi:rhodanese-related sulfurtransferase
MRSRFLLLTLAVAVLALALAVAGCSSDDAAAPAETGAPAESAGWTTVDVQTAADALSANADAQIVDMREPSEWAETGVPEGAVLIPLGDLEAQAESQLTTDAPVYVICRSGNRSQTGSDILTGLGLTEVHNVDGGMNAWTAAGLPTEAYQP